MRLEYLEAGEIVSTHGIHGEVKVLPWSDGPDFLLDYKRVCIDNKEYIIEGCRIQKTCTLLKLKGVDTMDYGQKLRGKIVKIYRCDAPDDIIFAAELMGIEVFSNGNSIGKVVDVLDYPGNKVYVVRGEFEYMIPAVKEFVLDTDMNAGTMQVKIIEGMRTDES